MGRKGADTGSDESGKQHRGLAHSLTKQVLKRYLAAAAGIFVLFLLALSFFFGIKLGKNESVEVLAKKTEITYDVLQQQLERIEELSTAKYYYTNMGKFENTLQFVGKTLPFTKKSFLISYDGVIKAGIRLEDVQIILDEKTIRITVPEAQILSHEMDFDSVVVFDEKNSVFNGLATEDVTGFQNTQKRTMEKKAIANGLLEESRKNTEASFKAIYQVIVSSDEYEAGYTLEFLH